MGSRQDKAKQCSVNEYQDETEEEGIIVIGEVDDAPTASSLNAPTFAELIANHTIPTRNGTEHDHGGKGQISGRALLVNECPDLAIVDIDIKRDLPKDKADVLCRQFLDKLANLAVPVAQTAHDGLHVYCIKGDYKQDTNRRVKCFSGEGFDVDLIVAVDHAKQPLVVLPPPYIFEGEWTLY
jgi:hypothetical protein